MYWRGSARLYQLLQSQVAEAAQTCCQSAAAVSRAATADAAQSLYQAQLRAGCHAWLQQLGSRSLQTWSRKVPLGLGSGLGKQQQQRVSNIRFHLLLQTTCMPA
jgi:hypothetical protein